MRESRAKRNVKSPDRSVAHVRREDSFGPLVNVLLLFETPLPLAAADCFEETPMDFETQRRSFSLLGGQSAP